MHRFSLSILLIILSEIIIGVKVRHNFFSVCKRLIQCGRKSKQKYSDINHIFFLFSFWKCVFCAPSLIRTPFVPKCLMPIGCIFRIVSFFSSNKFFVVIDRRNLRLNDCARKIDFHNTFKFRWTCKSNSIHKGNETRASKRESEWMKLAPQSNYWFFSRLIISTQMKFILLFHISPLNHTASSAKY